MLPYIIGGAIVLSVAALMKTFSDEVHIDKLNWERGKEAFYREAAELERRLEEAKREANNLIFKPSFDSLMELRRGFIQASSCAYETYDSLKNTIQTTKNNIQEAFDKKGEIKEFLKRNRLPKEEYQAKINDIRSFSSFINTLKTSLNNNYAEKEKFLADVRRFNNRTHEINELIRDTCGERGRNWYNRLQERKRNGYR